MTNEALSVFKSPQFGRIRLSIIEGREYFCSSDVAEALGYTNPRDAVRRHCKGVVKHDAMIQRSNTGDKLIHQIMSFIPEGDVYRLITHSKLPAAEAFESWVFDEVLPSFRQYDSHWALISRALASPDFLMELAGKLKWEQQARLAVTEKLKENEEKVFFADAICASKDAIMIGDLAKLLKQNGVEIGANRLFEWLREKCFLIKKKGSQYNTPTQKAMKLGLLELTESCSLSGSGTTTIHKVTKVTTKGQHYFILKFLREDAMKRNELSDFTMRLIRQNEREIRAKALCVEKAQRDIEEMKQQNRDLMGRESHETVIFKASQHKKF